MHFFNSINWLYYQKYVNQITLNHTILQSLALSIIIWGLPCIFIGCESFFESNTPDILALCEPNEQTHWFYQFLCHLALSRKNWVAYMYGFSVYVKEGLPFERDLCLAIFEGSFWSNLWKKFLRKFLKKFIFIYVSGWWTLL